MQVGRASTPKRVHAAIVSLALVSVFASRPPEIIICREVGQRNRETFPDGGRLLGVDTSDTGSPLKFGQRRVVFLLFP